jgi:hypothetical protein
MAADAINLASITATTIAELASYTFRMSASTNLCIGPNHFLDMARGAAAIIHIAHLPLF